MINYIINGITHTSDPENEERIKRELKQQYKAWDIVTCIDWNGKILESDRMDVIFDYGKAE